MGMTTRTLVVCLISSASIVCLKAQPAFEVADVHVSPTSTAPNKRGGFMRGERYEVRNATMIDLIRSAWGVDADKVVGGPGWLDIDRFDVIAIGPAGTTPESLQPMLQALLAERFKLVVHRDSRPFPEYVLTAGTHPRLKEAAAGGESGCHRSPQNANVSCRNITMAQFAARLPQMAGDYFQGNPLIDLTQLKGSWDFTLTWTGRNQMLTAGLATAEAGGTSIYDALEKQLGLKLDVQKVPMPVIAVDSVNEKPTGNASGVSQSLPAIPTEFEVAVIKPSAPGSTQRSFRFEPGGRIDLQDFTLRELIKFAWDFKDLDVIDNDEMLVGAPKWLDTERFDITAKAAAPGPTIDRDSLHLMLRTLLRDRFKLAAHNENQLVPVYTLVAVKPKLRKADLSSRAGCRLVPAPSGAAPLFFMVCRKTTMSQLAENLQPWGGIYVPHPVIDSTRLEGAWDFILSWSPPHLLQGCGGCSREAGLAAAAAGGDPNGGLTLVEALDKQLGLKLKLEKYPMPVLVIDHVEPRPTEN